MITRRRLWSMLASAAGTIGLVVPTASRLQAAIDADMVANYPGFLLKNGWATYSGPQQTEKLIVAWMAKLATERSVFMVSQTAPHDYAKMQRLFPIDYEVLPMSLGSTPRAVWEDLQMQREKVLADVKGPVYFRAEPAIAYIEPGETWSYPEGGWKARARIWCCNDGKNPVAA